jgi:mono/diheme cytochrome c family protein
VYHGFVGTDGNVCADCHGSSPGVGGINKILQAAGTVDSQGIPSVISGQIRTNAQMTQFSGLSSQDIADLAAYINASKWGKPLQ